MIRKEINVITGEEKIIPLTAKEIEQKNNNEIENQKVIQKQLDKEAKKESAKAKLSALGLDEEEIKAIIGA